MFWLMGSEKPPPQANFDLLNSHSTPPFSNMMFMCTKMNYILTQIILLVDDIIHASFTCVDKKQWIQLDFAMGWTKSKTIFVMNIKTITTASDFVLATVNL
jgi:hypothetical protein